MKIHLKRLYNGLASARDYQVQKCKETGEPLIFTCADRKGETMTVHIEDSFQIVGTKFKSKYDGKEYTLIDFRWKADKEKNDEN